MNAIEILSVIAAFLSVCATVWLALSARSINRARGDGILETRVTSLETCQRDLERKFTDVAHGRQEDATRVNGLSERIARIETAVTAVERVERAVNAQGERLARVETKLETVAKSVDQIAHLGD